MVKSDGSNVKTAILFLKIKPDDQNTSKRLKNNNYFSIPSGTVLVGDGATGFPWLSRRNSKSERKKRIDLYARETFIAQHVYLCGGNMG